MNQNRILTSKGYAILKKSLTPEKQEWVRKQLTVAPKLNNKFLAKPTPFPVFFESPTRFYLPRHWAREHFGPEEESIIPEGEPLPKTAVFTGKPFDYQENIIESFVGEESKPVIVGSTATLPSAGRKAGEGLICVPCGKGKTFMALAIAARLGGRFLIVVDKEFFLEQWRAEINRFFPGLRVGVLQGDRCETATDKYDCTIMMIQTLVQRSFPADFVADYRLAIFDECHHLGAQNFSQSLLKVQTKHMLGLSATPEREDKLERVFYWHIGPAVYQEKTREADDTVTVRTVHYRSKDTSYSDEPVDWRGEVVMARLLGQVVEHEERTRMVVEIIKEVVAAEPGRCILVLSERKNMLERIEQLLTGVAGMTVGYYVGGMKAADRDWTAREANVILATYSMSSEGMSIARLNAVILASPRKKVEQSVGRILRERVADRKIGRLIVDIVDQHGLYQGQARKRAAFYKECGYRIMVQTFQEGAFNELLEIKSKEAKATTTAKTKSKTPTIVDSSDSEGSLELLSEEED
jgi:superfamily II DNA or RNA helicase